MGLASLATTAKQEVGQQPCAPDTVLIRTRHHDKNMAAMQQSDISPVRSEVGSIGPEAMLFSKASYTTIDTVPGVL